MTGSDEIGFYARIDSLWNFPMYLLHIVYSGCISYSVLNRSSSPSCKTVMGYYVYYVVTWTCCFYYLVNILHILCRKSSITCASWLPDNKISHEVLTLLRCSLCSIHVMQHERMPAFSGIQPCLHSLDWPVFIHKMTLSIWAHTNMTVHLCPIMAKWSIATLA